MLSHMLSVYAFCMYIFLFMIYIINLVRKIKFTGWPYYCYLLGNSLDYLLPETECVSCVQWNCSE